MRGCVSGLPTLSADKITSKWPLTLSADNEGLCVRAANIVSWQNNIKMTTDIAADDEGLCVSAVNIVGRQCRVVCCGPKFVSWRRAMHVTDWHYTTTLFLRVTVSRSRKSVGRQPPGTLLHSSHELTHKPCHITNILLSITVTKSLSHRQHH